MSGTTEEFTKLKAGGRFAIYAFGIYLATTFTIGCLGVIIGSPLLTLPLAMLISHPIIWIAIGIALAVTYKVAIKPLYRLVRNGKGASKEEKSNAESTELQKLPEEKQAIVNQKLQREKTAADRESPNPNPDGDSGVSINSPASKQTKVVHYSTAGDGDCFFHATFGDNSSGQYKAEKAQEMRMEWHKFLSQFNSLDDARMSAPLKAQLGKVFNMFLNKPEDLTDKFNKIKRLAGYTNKKVEKIKKKVKQLKKKLLCAGLQENEVDSNLKELAVSNFFSTRRYDKNYNSENAANSFLNSRIIYESYLDSIKSQNYFVFIEEILILASLANIEINVHYKNNGKDERTVFKPNLEMINEDYQQNDELWGEKEKEMIHLAANHYSRAGIVELEETQSVLEKIGSVVKGATASVCDALGLNT
ncbi:MAG: hypothetical protein ACR5K9_02685 [Wolbachia sp.]